MEALTRDKIKHDIADSQIIFYRGEEIYENGDLLFLGRVKDGIIEFKNDGNFGD